MRGLTAEVSREELFSMVPLLLKKRRRSVFTFADSAVSNIYENEIYSVNDIKQETKLILIL